MKRKSLIRLINLNGDSTIVRIFFRYFDAPYINMEHSLLPQPLYASTPFLCSIWRRKRRHGIVCSVECSLQCEWSMTPWLVAYMWLLQLIITVHFFPVSIMWHDRVNACFVGQWTIHLSMDQWNIYWFAYLFFYCNNNQGNNNKISVIGNLRPLIDLSWTSYAELVVISLADFILRGCAHVHTSK